MGYLKYYEAKNNDKPIALGIILGVVLPILAIITLLSICVIRRHLKHGPSDTENYLPDVLRDEDEKKEEEIALSLVNGDIANDKGRLLNANPKVKSYLANILEHIITHIKKTVG